ncbi:MAG: metalloregulator ArsR/SmtB family transcription factor [Pseudomonadota bacterium]
MSAAPQAPATSVDAMAENAAEAAEFVKCFAHESRLMILCHLTEGERSVGELETLLGARQSAVSQHLARLRLDGIVTYRREGKTLYYSIADPRAQRLLTTLHDLFCAPEAD